MTVDQCSNLMGHMVPALGYGCPEKIAPAVRGLVNEQGRAVGKYCFVQHLPGDRHPLNLHGAVLVDDFKTVLYCHWNCKLYNIPTRTKR